MQCFICLGLVLVLFLHNKLVVLFLARIEYVELLIILFLSMALGFYIRRADYIVPKPLGHHFTPLFCNGGYVLLQYLLLLYIFHCYFGVIGIFQSN